MSNLCERCTDFILKNNKEIKIKKDKFRNFGIDIDDIILDYSNGKKGEGIIITALGIKCYIVNSNEK